MTDKQFCHFEVAVRASVVERNQPALVLSVNVSSVLKLKIKYNQKLSCIVNRGWGGWRGFYRNLIQQVW